jgi:hypothetical protein
LFLANTNWLLSDAKKPFKVQSHHEPKAWHDFQSSSHSPTQTLHKKYLNKHRNSFKLLLSLSRDKTLFMFESHSRIAFEAKPRHPTKLCNLNIDQLVLLFHRVCIRSQLFMIAFISISIIQLLVYRYSNANWSFFYCFCLDLLLLRCSNDKSRRKDKSRS